LLELNGSRLLRREGDFLGDPFTAASGRSCVCQVAQAELTLECEPLPARGVTFGRHAAARERRSLALRLERLPHVAQALSRAQLGVEAVLQVVRIATSRTEIAWLERARQRTVKHLREEVSAALTAVRLSGETDCPPPRDEELERFQELERAVLSGAVWGGTPNRPQPDCTPGLGETSRGGSRELSSRRPWRDTLSSLTAWLEQGALTHAVRMSAPSMKRSAGRVEVRWRVSLGLRTWCMRSSRGHGPFLPGGMSWVKFLCLVFACTAGGSGRRAARGRFAGARSARGALSEGGEEAAA
jgi:hypothetical protein